jgi:ribonuclease HI/ADP-ribose pyrophosphatase YjhB (NUDIX family)
MKQRVVVQAIIRRDNKILLLRRSVGRPELIGSYELPGGRLDEHQQPDESIKQYVTSSTGQDIGEIKLVSASALISDDEPDIQHVFVTYDVVLTTDDGQVTLNNRYDEYVWQELSLVQQLKLRDSAQKLLNLLHLIHFVPNLLEKEPTVPERVQTSTHVIINSDGGSRGNPGESAAAFVIVGDSQQVLDQGGEYLGITTNNQAEYHGVRLGLERALQLGVKTVDFRMDSLLVVNQMKGLYKIKNRELWPINERIRGLVARFDKVRFSHVDRSLNQAADRLVNQILDEHKRTGE